MRACRTRAAPWPLLLALALLPAAAPAFAQETLPATELPDSVAQGAVAFYNAPGTIRLSGQSRIASGTVLVGQVASLGGPVNVQGRIEGDLLVINGDLTLGPAAEVTGTATVIGGVVSAVDSTAVRGGINRYAEPMPYRQDAGDLVYLPPPPEPQFSAGRDFGFGRTDLLIAVRGGYNRVEGLPVAVGPRLRFGHGNPTLLEALAIYRSAQGARLDTDELGYSASLEQYIGGGRTTRIGVRAYSEIAPVEAYGLTDGENSLATFVLHRDYRDMYRRKGWAGYIRWGRPGRPDNLRLEYRDEHQTAVAPTSPWSLFDNKEPWRPEPFIAQGTLRSLAARYEYDTRNEEADPSAGWWIRAQAEQGLGGTLFQPMSDSVPPPGYVGAAGARERFTAATFDVRRYARFTPYSRISARLFAAGSVDGTALPPQRQHTLGGEGSLPGFPLFAFDCGARRATVAVDGEPFFPYYGCDRVALLQLEYQAALPFGRRLGSHLGWALDSGQGIRWVAFIDAGRAWIEPDALNGRLTGDDDFAADAGLGLRLGQIGIYWALPLAGGGHGLNFFIRLGRRL